MKIVAMTKMGMNGWSFSDSGQNAAEYDKDPIKRGLLCSSGSG
jgi:hypothetical protein